MLTPRNLLLFPARCHVTCDLDTACIWLLLDVMNSHACTCKYGKCFCRMQNALKECVEKCADDTAI